METKTHIEILSQISEILKGFRGIIAETKSSDIHLSSTIHNVGLVTLINVFYALNENGKATLCAPGEFGNPHKYVVVYKVAIPYSRWKRKSC